MKTVLSFLCAAALVLGARATESLVSEYELREVGAVAADAFTWDEHGRLWTMRQSDGKTQLRVSSGEEWTVPLKIENGVRLGGFLTHENRILVADNNSIRDLDVTVGQELTEKVKHTLPTATFPSSSRILSLQWGPLGHVYFAYGGRSTGESGIGRLERTKGKWEIIAKGLDFKHLSFDEHGRAVGVDAGSKLLFRVAPGIDYEAGLENYTKRDVAVAVDDMGGLSLATSHTQGKWTLFDRSTRRLREFYERGVGLVFQRDLAMFDNDVDVWQMQIGPDGALWVLTQHEQTGRSALLRFSEKANASAPKDLSKLSTVELVTHLESPNQWQRDTALRILASRSDLLSARGLHPSTPLHTLLQNNDAPAIARANALRGLHRVSLLDDTALEDASTAGPWELRVAAIELIGERGYPTPTAFSGMEKNGGHTNRMVRTAVAIAARRFVSGSIVEDTPPAIPIREVFIGGPLSGLWFSTENGSTPEFDLLYWNAVRPITAFDAAHAIGFFQGDGEDRIPLAPWLMERFGRQIALMDDPLRQEDAILMMGNIKPVNHRLLLHGLDGLISGFAVQKAAPTAKAKGEVQKWTNSDRNEIAAKAKALLNQWK